MDYTAISTFMCVFYVITFMSFTTYVAYQKGYSWQSWLVLGIFFGLLELLVTLGLPKKDRQEDVKPIENLRANDPNDMSKRFI
jgi:hypothetical protein